MMRAAAIGLLIALSVACGSRSRRTRAASSAGSGEFSLQVINHHFLDVTIYVLHDGERSRVGLVTATTTQTFVLPGRILGQAHDITLFGEVVGSSNVVRTDRLIVRPGQLVEWTLETDLRRSSVGVY